MNSGSVTPDAVAVNLIVVPPGCGEVLSAARDAAPMREVPVQASGLVLVQAQVLVLVAPVLAPVPALLVLEQQHQRQ